jgi:hypothetical protein
MTAAEVETWRRDLAELADSGLFTNCAVVFSLSGETQHKAYQGASFSNAFLTPLPSLLASLNFRIGSTHQGRPNGS